MRLVSSTRTGLALRDQSHAVGAIGAIGAIGDIVPATCISSDKRLNARKQFMCGSTMQRFPLHQQYALDDSLIRQTQKSNGDAPAGRKVSP